MSEKNPDRAIFIVHSLEHAIAASKAAAAAGRSIQLRSARGAAGYAGIGWFAALIEETRHRVPSADLIGAIDCAADLALAFEACAAGIDAIRYDGIDAGLEKLRDVAAQYGVALDTAGGESLDLAKSTDFERSTHDFLH